jgi:hypothetical protein
MTLAACGFILAGWKDRVCLFKIGATEMEQNSKTPIGSEDARQGSTGNGVRYVLGFSLVLAIVVLAIALGVVG